MRFERLVDGIEVAEKVRTLRAKYAGREELKPLEEMIVAFRSKEITQRDYDWQSVLAKAQKTLHDVSKALAD